MTLATNNIIVGSLGSFVMGLRFADAAFCAIIGCLLGTCTVGYISTWGPRSGARTLIATRYFMGYYPSKICCFLNIFTNIGYSMMNCVIGGQILSMVSGGRLSVIVGVVIVSICSWSMAMFGMKVFQIYERCAWVPQLMVLCVMLGSAAPHFDFDVHTDYSPGHLNAKRLTFVSLSLSTGLAWAPLAADYYVYYPPHIKRWKTFSVTVLGSFMAMAFTIILGIGLGTILASSPALLAKYGNSPGGLMMTAYDSLGGLGKFCAVINVLALVANNTPGAYSMGMNFQMLGGVFRKVPRSVFTTVATVGFLPLIGYWVIMWLVIVLEEDIIFRRKIEYDWSKWNSPPHLPLGAAATMAFMIGWAGAVIGMDQAYYAGVIAEAAGGSDLGLWVGAGFTAAIFPPLRLLERWFMGR
ncbi:hypothetical protein N7468_002182 [Penicillium chermesinum]|uniref:Purine-cytosine permease n=1 Tax=Penicillium chermesinum TaxID=63820 RepID=A0A9W9PI96_9EURO|nr:uncharacterized protein N7468_002182 [Penicillium chermesinum]KAJ5247199.1 hypothetical protein N7468_002182 [Penicillium chermesinum]